jgi:hypothetical protein
MRRFVAYRTHSDLAQFFFSDKLLSRSDQNVGDTAKHFVYAFQYSTTLSESVFVELTTVQQNYADTFCTEFYRNRSRDMEITYTNS